MRVKDKIIEYTHSNAANLYAYIRKKYFPKLPPILIKNHYLSHSVQTAKINKYSQRNKDHIYFALQNQDLQSLFNHEQINQLLDLMEKTSLINGDVIELGTYKGGTTVLMARFLIELKSEKKIYTCDTFEGFPYAETGTSNKIKLSTGEVKNQMDLFKDTSFEIVKSKFESFNISHKIKILKGSFDTTLPSLSDERFSFALVDCDIYDSTVIVLREIWPRMIPGGIMLFDDYNSEKEWNLKKAVDDFCRLNNLVLHQGVMPYLLKPV